ncbi:MAG: Xaa-Pro peptidase family protein [Candidatus Methanomethylicia archaeon]|nr:Xaa-Pro peptidase family protein [Candidatus Methanomethylicia archaeon]
MSYIDGWSYSVLKNRHDRIKEYLSKRDLKALVILDALNIIYVSGFFLDVAPWERPVVAVIPLDGEPFLFLNELSINSFKFHMEQGRGIIKEAYFYVEHPKQVNRFPTVVEWNKYFSGLLEEKGLDRGRIATDNVHVLQERIRGYLHEVSVVDAHKLLRDMRLVKCEEELNLMRRAGELSDIGQEIFKEKIKLGKTLLEIGAETALELTRIATEKYPKYEIQVFAGGTGDGPFSAMPHGPGGYSGRRIQIGDVIVNGIGVVLNRYNVENERTFFVGKPSEKQLKCFEIATKAQIAALEMCVEGRRVCDIDSAAQKIIEEAGFGEYIMHRTGHGMGLAGHEYWHDTAFNYRIMKYGMVTSVEPGIYIYGFGGFRHSDTVIIGKQKPESVTKFSKEVEDLTIKV